MKMVKKGMALAFAAAIALTLAGCSNSSDSGAAIFAGGTGTGNGGGNNGRGLDRTGLPANVGSNDFVGKTFSYTYDGATAKYAFGSDTVTFTSTFPSTETVTVSSYSFNATTKQLFLKKVSSSSYFINDGTRTALPEMDSFTSDAEFIAAYKKGMKQLYPSYTDEQLTNSAKGMRYSTFAPYGYTDSTNATEVSNEIIAKYNAAKAESKTRNTLVDIYAYDLSGSTLKLLNDSRIPAGKGLNEIYGVYNTRYFVSPRYVDILAIKDGSDNIVYNLSYSSMPSVTPDITNAASNAGYRVSSISESAINTSATATGTGLLWTFTPATGSFSYTTNKTATSGVFDITGLGKITVTYATAGNIPDMTSAGTFIEDKTQNDAQSAGDENASSAETSVFKAEAVEGGIKITIKPFAQAVKNPLIFICGTGADKSENRLDLEWADGSVAWTCLYPYVTAGNSYWIALQADSGLAEQTLQLKASDGIGAIPKEGSVSLTVAADKITATINDYAVNEKIPGGTSGLTNMWTVLEFFAGDGWVEETSTWDGAYINAFWHDNFTTTLEIPNSDQVYKTLKSKMTGEYNGKKLYFQPYYCIKKPGIPAKIRICNWNTRVAPADMHWN